MATSEEELLKQIPTRADITSRMVEAFKVGRVYLSTWISNDDNIFTKWLLSKELLRRKANKWLPKQTNKYSNYLANKNKQMIFKKMTFQKNKQMIFQTNKHMISQINKQMIFKISNEWSPKQTNKWSSKYQMNNMPNKLTNKWTFNNQESEQPTAAIAHILPQWSTRKYFLSDREYQESVTI